MKRWLFFADTPLQIYNSSIIASDLLEKGQDVDLLVYDQFPSAKHLCEAYERLHLFEAIALCPRVIARSFQEKILWEAQTALGARKAQFGRYINNRYDTLALACPSPATFELLATLKKSSPNLSVVFYEDGTGSYNGSTLQQPFYFDVPPINNPVESKKLHLIRRLFALPLFRKLRYEPQALYLKRPDMVQTEIQLPVEKMPSSVPYLSDLAENLNQGVIPLREGNNIVLIDPYRENWERKNGTVMDALAERILDKGMVPYARLHPRSEYKPGWAEKCIDYSNGFWELICRTETALDDALLIGTASTAQLSPVIECGRKPFLLFVYRLLPQPYLDKFGGDEYLEIFKQIVDSARTGYGDCSNRIFVPETYSETLEIIDAYRSHRLS